MDALLSMAKFPFSILKPLCLMLMICCVLGFKSLDDAIEAFSKDVEMKDELEKNFPAVAVVVPDLTEEGAEEILDQIGFNATEENFTHDGVKDKIMQFQKRHGIPETGELCRSTKLMLMRPRCGVSDVAAFGEDYRWDKNVLTYNIRDFPAKIAPSTVRQLVQKAFNQWSAVTNLDFIESENSGADIEILFGGRIHSNRWQSCITEMGDTTLAHAFYPQGGAIHFNTRFYFGSHTEDDFYTTAMHEIGHALGLDHSVDPASIMYPALVARFDEIPLIDAEKIQLKYGKREQMASMPIEKFCDLPKYDAVLYDSNGKLSFIAGKYFYSTTKLNKTPILVTRKWPGVADHLDTAVTIESQTYMFRDDQVWAFESGKLVPGYPRMIRKTFPGIPKNLDAIVHYKNKYMFAFKKEHFWRYNVAEKMVDHSGEVQEFGVPAQIDAALYDKQRNVIVFYKDQLRYVYNCDTLETTTEYDRMFGC